MPDFKRLITATYTWINVRNREHAVFLHNLRHLPHLYSNLWNHSAKKWKFGYGVPIQSFTSATIETSQRKFVEKYCSTELNRWCEIAWWELYGDRGHRTIETALWCALWNAFLWNLQTDFLHQTLHTHTHTHTTLLSPVIHLKQRCSAVRDSHMHANF